MKILQVNKFAYARGGAEQHMLNLIDMLRTNGHEVFVFAMRHPENLRWPDEDLFVSQVSFDRPKKLSEKIRAVTRMFYSFEAARKFSQLLDRRQPDIIHVHNIYHQLSPSILREAKKRNIPVVMTLHDFKLLAPNYLLYANGQVSESTRPKSYWKVLLKKEIKGSFLASKLCALELYIHKLLKIYEKNIDLFVAPSKFMAEKVKEYTVEVKKLEVIANPLPQRKLPAPEDKGYALFFGRLAEEKGVDILLEAWREISDLPLKILGTGPLELQLRQKAASIPGHNVQFLGYKSGEDLDDLIAGAKMVIFPSRWYENQPMSLIEAFRFAKPIVASRLGAIPELVHDGKGGRLIPPNDPHTLALTVRELWHSADLKKMGQYNLEQSERFSSEKYYERIMPLYQELIEQGRK